MSIYKFNFEILVIQRILILGTPREKSLFLQCRWAEISQIFLFRNQRIRYPRREHLKTCEGLFISWVGLIPLILWNDLKSTLRALSEYIWSPLPSLDLIANLAINFCPHQCSSGVCNKKTFYWVGTINERLWLNWCKI